MATKEKDTGTGPQPKGRVHLTLDKIRKLKTPTEKTVYHFDDDPRQLCVRVTTRGAKSFVYRGKLSGESLRITIGDTDVWNLDDARAEARRLQTIVDNGDDPREVADSKKKAKEHARLTSQAAIKEREEKNRYTLRALCEAYCDHLEAGGKLSARQARSVFKCHVFETHAAHSQTPAKEITSPQIAAMVRSVIEQGKERTAGVLRAYLCAAYTAAIKSPYDASLPSTLIPFGIVTNPTDPIPAIASNDIERHLTRGEIKSYLASLGDDLIDVILKLTFFSGGQRMAQLLRAEVSDYDAQQSTLRLWDGKGKRKKPREHLIPLAPKGAAMVASLIERASRMNTQLLFSTHGKILVDPTTPGKRVAEISVQMGGESFGLNDLRRTVETQLVILGISEKTRAHLLSHGLTGIQHRKYDRHIYFSEKRTALVAWESLLDDIVTGNYTTNVVQLKTTA